MHLNELNHRSPLRVFERSVHGGLGRGNLGIVAARAGVGKSGFLTCVALDALLRGRKVLQLTTTRTVGHVRDFYDEIFSDLARTANLEETLVARRKMEENRFIHSVAGSGFDVDRLGETIEILRANADFVPDVIVIDGHDFADGADGAGRIRNLARGCDAELWMSLRTTRKDVTEDWHDLPRPVADLGDVVSVAVYLQPVGAAVRIRLLRDHDSESPEDPGLDLDPRTLLVAPA